MYVLGIHQGHDSSTTLVKDGKIIASVAEERLTKIKHYGLLPWRGLDYCLASAKINIKDVDLIVFPSIAKNELLKVILGRQKESLFTKQFPEKQKRPLDYFRLLAIEATRKLDLYTTPAQPPTYVKKFPYPKENPLWHIDHHLAHAASAYYTCGFKEKTLVITIDGSGDGLATTVWIGENGQLTERLKLGRESSLGAFYGLVTEALGWWVGNGEGRTMGLAPYGSTKKTKGILDKFLPHYESGKLKKGYDWGWPGIWEDQATFHFHFKDQDISEVQSLIKKHGRENVAAEAQRALEEQMLNLIVPWIEKENVKYLTAAGGVFLNVKANQRLWETGLLKDYFVFPDAGDGGIAAGAALYGYFKKKPADFKKTRQIRSASWGPKYSVAKIEKVLKTRKVKYQKLPQQKMAKKVAEILAKNQVIATFAGQMESGPRALGNRSIMMSPMRAENKDLINDGIKYREPWRPFCPSMTPKAAKAYLQNPHPNPGFMIISFDVPQNKIKDIPAVVHVDGTTRPQVVNRSQNRFYFDVIKEFGRLTGVEVILNTSFNIRGQPIIANPEDAVKCFYDTGLDYLVLEGQLLVKK